MENANEKMIDLGAARSIKVRGIDVRYPRPYSS